MAPPGLFVTATLLALSVVGTAKDKVKILQFTDPHCDGHPVGKPFELKNDECKGITAAAVKIQRPNKDKYLNGWINRVNDGEKECWVDVYKQPGCPRGAHLPYPANYQNVRPVSVPGEFEQCINNFDPFDKSIDYLDARSIKWHCEDPRDVGYQVNVTKTLHVTAYSLDPFNTPHSSIYTTTVLTPSWIYHQAPPKRTLEPRVEPSAGHAIEARAPHHNAKAVWMKQPWGYGDVCFECWSKKISILSDFKCEAGPKTSIACGVSPFDDHSNPDYWTNVTDAASTTVQTNLVEIHLETVILTTDPPFATPSPLSPGLEARSEKKKVRLEHPFVRDHEVCAEAKWHHRGKLGKQRVEISGPKDCDRDGEEWPLDIQYTSSVPGSTTTVTRTVTRTVSPQIIVTTITATFSP